MSSVTLDFEPGIAFESTTGDNKVLFCKRKKKINKPQRRETEKREKEREGEKKPLTFFEECFRMSSRSTCSSFAEE